VKGKVAGRTGGAQKIPYRRADRLNLHRHPNSAAQAISRFTSWVLQSGIELPYRAIKGNLGDALDLLVHMERRGGHRRIAELLEICRFNPEIRSIRTPFAL